VDCVDFDALEQEARAMQLSGAQRLADIKPDLIAR